MTDWELTGDAVEGCTSPPVCPYYWGSSVQKDLHDGRDQCEGTYTLRIDRGQHGDISLDGLRIGIGFNTPANGRQSGNPWAAILYIDENADSSQFNAIAEVFRTSWARVGKLSSVKRTRIKYEKAALGVTPAQGYRYRIECAGFYKLETEPLVTAAGTARFISGLRDGIIYVGKSNTNIYKDPDLPRGEWDKPGMSSVYFSFKMNPLQLDWVP